MMHRELQSMCLEGTLRTLASLAWGRRCLAGTNGTANQHCTQHLCLKASSICTYG